MAIGVQHDANAGPPGRCARAMTLLEVILALTLMVLLLSGVYGFYSTSLRAREEGGKIAQDVMLARSILEKMGEEIRHATDIVPGDGIGFQGRKDTITIIRTRMPERYAFEEFDSVADTLPPAQLDLLRTQYSLLWDEELVDDEGVPICHGLWRSEQKTFDPNPNFVVKDDQTSDTEEEPQPAAPPVEGELTAPEIKYLEFEYFDGVDWRDRWHVPPDDTEAATAAGPEGGVPPSPTSTGPPAPTQTEPGRGDYALPQAVRITVGRVRVPPDEEEFDITQLKEMEEESEKEEHHPDRFTIVVYLNQADQSLLSSRKHGMDNDPNLQTGGEQ